MAAEFADVHFLGLDTAEEGRIRRDLCHVHAVIDALVPRLTRNSVLVANRRYRGTAADLAKRLPRWRPQK